MKYYKFLTADNKGQYSDYDYTAYLPKDGKPGKWLRKTGKVDMCRVGYHACDKMHLFDWINAQLYEVEYQGEVTVGDTKVVGQKMRFIRKVETWNDKTLRLYAVWCAREALKPIDNPDPRSIAACDVAERYASGEATSKELNAVRDAAWVAVRDAAWDAARVAAAWVAVRDAARAAARVTAVAAQNEKLCEMLGLEKGGEE